jgi:uncharacterized secreted protein with C-terminal beta-propeller domain
MSRRLLLCVTLLLAGCTASPQASPAPSPPRPAPDLNLVAFDSCEKLATDLRAAALPLVGPYGLPGDYYGTPAVVSNGARTSVAIPAPAAPDAPPAHSGTNVQEQGVDEPDIVKTDGRRIVTVGPDGVLRVVDAASRVQTGKLDLGLSASAGRSTLLLAGDRALILVPPGIGDYHSQPVPLGGGLTRMAVIGEPGRPEVILVNLAGAPTVISRYTGEGTIVDARQTGSIGRVVLKTSPRIKFPLLPDVQDNTKRTAANHKIVQAAPPADWLPNWQVTTGATTTQGHVGCDRVSRPTEFSGTSMLTVLTFDLGAAALTDGDPVSVLADGETVYGTPTSLYVTNDQRWLGLLPNRVVPNRTQIFRFDTTGRPAFVADGTVTGLPINQYALSEWDGHLRIATTDSKDGGSSAVRVLQQQGNQLVQIGVVDGLGKGERIYAVRFVGPRGYVVTFKQTDPLYSVDLSDPTKPQVTGALKIPGFSSHLQPISDDRLIGIGEDGQNGTQVSLFDVSNPAESRRLAQQHVSGTSSAAEHDPHALLWWPATRLLVVPVTVWDPRQSGQQNAAMALRVTDNGLERIAMIQQPGNNHPKAGQERFPAIDRTLVIGDVLWTLSSAGLQASNLSSLDRVGWLPS